MAIIKLQKGGKQMKKFLKGIIGVLVFTMIFIGFTEPFTYADAPSTWAEDIISEAKEHGLTPLTLQPVYSFLF